MDDQKILLDDLIVVATLFAMQRRAQGFQHERLVVLPESVAQDSSLTPLLDRLIPVAAGHFPRAAGHFVERSEALEEAIVLLCVSGQGWVRVGRQRELPVPAPSLVFIPAGSPHAYGADAHDPWSIHWAHLKGDDVERLRQLLVPDPRSIVLPFPETLAQRLDFAAVHQLLEEDYSPQNLLEAAAQIRLVLLQIHRHQRRYPSHGDSDPIERSAAWMRRNLATKASLAQLAAVAGFSIPHYSARFKKRTGYPPIDYFLRMKVQRACRLLDTTEQSIESIAAAVGYDDPFYFSRLFRRVMNQSPRAYRATPKG